MRFLVDMGLDVRLALWLRERGHDAVHLSEVGLQRLPDTEIFAEAVAESRVILTCDLDFGEIAAFSTAALIGVILFRVAEYRLTRIVDRLDATLPAIESRLSAGAIVTIEDDRFRLRLLPIE
jgi:predicted nuclease of predicted toxin-antitoxin system